MKINSFFNVTEGADKAFMISAVGLLLFGLVVVTSAYIGHAARVESVTIESFLKKQMIYICIGLCAFFVAVKTPTRVLDQFSTTLLILAYVLLVVVLFPYISQEYNGAQRWLNFKVVTLQVSEVSRLCILIYLASYMVRRGDNVRDTLSGFVLPMVLIAIACGLLLCEPDFGAAVILTMTCLGMLFLAGARLWQFVVTILFASGGFLMLTVLEPYRMKRFMAFLDPWGDRNGSGYQLIQSLIAYGSGGKTGVGLGGSVQKLGHLPEAHNDFVLAVLAEELGFMAVVAVVCVYALLIYRIFVIGGHALERKMPFGGFLCFGIGVWLACQVFVNIYVTMGLLPTKGLTLPLMSSGGSAILMVCASLGIVARVNYEVVLSLRVEEEKKTRKLKAREKRINDGLTQANPADLEAMKAMLGVAQGLTVKGRVK